MPPTLRCHEVVRPPRELVERCRAFRSPDVANGLGDEALLEPAIRPVWRAPLLVGPALTVAVPPGDNFGVAAATMLAEPGDVIVVSAGGGLGAMVGGLIARLALDRGVAGFIVDGAVRDCDDFEQLGLPVFARHVAPHRATKHGDATVGGAILCGGRTIRAGDVVIGDRDGVAVIAGADLPGALAKIDAELAIDKASEGDLGTLRARFAKLVGAAARVRLPPE